MILLPVVSASSHVCSLFVGFVILTVAHFSANFIRGHYLRAVLKVHSVENNLYSVQLGTLGCYQLRIGL